MNSKDRNNNIMQPGYKKNVIDERFEQNAGVKIIKGKENYSGGSGYYSVKAKPECPNVNDGGTCDMNVTNG